MIRKFALPYAGLIAVWSACVYGQAAPASGAARDIQTSCALSGLPAVSELTVSWSGECVAGMAAGVGDVFAFRGGKLQYILRGLFRDGALQRTDRTRDCANDACADDVPPSLVRRHQQAASSLRTALAVSPAPVAQPSGANAAASQALSEVRAPDGVYRGKVYVDPQTGVLSGEVRVEYSDGRRFEGTLQNGRKVGFGTHTWADGQRYAGLWRDDIQHGLGTFTFANGDVYDGAFVEGQRTGQGTLKQKSGNSYVGQWVRGVREGQGIEEWANGQRYEGSWKDNRKDGQGSMRFADGGSYDGDWKNDRADGQGVGIFRWGSGDRFEGDFESGKPTNRGTMTFLAEAVAASLPAGDGAVASTDVAPPALSTVVTPAVSPALPPSRAALCATAFNNARNLVAVRRFIDSFPDDECSRHALARQKIATWEEQARTANRAMEERQAAAKAFIGAAVAFKQEFPFCVAGAANATACQRVIYVFDVRAKIREIDLQRRVVLVQISEATSLGNEKGAATAVFNEGRAAATTAYKTRNVGSTVSKTLGEVGLVF
jgi:hypothetical protein